MSDGDGRRPSRWFAVALAAIPLLALVLAEFALLARHATDSDRPRPAASPVPSTTPTTQADRLEHERTLAVRELLRHRAHAVIEHDRAEWRATLDPQHRSFIRRQMRAFDNLREVPFRSWSYRFSARSEQLPTRRLRRYDATTFAPSTMVLHYRLRGYDRRPTSLLQYPTFVQRGSQWYLTSLSDFEAHGLRSSTDLWDYGPVSVVRDRDVLVLGHPQSVTLMRSIAAEAVADIPRVTAVWGRGWARQVVILVPASQAELGRVVADFDDLDNIAAVATAEVSAGSGRPDPVGDRVGINPENWPRLSLLGRRIVLTHELTHVATRAVTSGATPRWLAEGFADYVGYLGSGVPTTFVAQDLRAEVQQGDGLRGLPRNRDFRGSSDRLSEAYEGAWLACRLIAQRWGEQALVRFYTAVGRATTDRRAAVADAAQRVLHVPAARFVADWRRFVRSELG